MRELDLKSLLIAGAVGALVLFLYEEFSSEPLGMTTSTALGVGFLVGSSVQFSVRMLGVS